MTVLKNFGQLLKCCAKDSDPRSYLRGVGISMIGTAVRFSATDDHRIAILDYDGILLGGNIPPRTYLIPTRSAKTIHLMSKAPGFIMRYDGHDEIDVQTDHDHLTIRLLRENTPDLDHFIPQDTDKPPTTITLNKKYLAAVPGDYIQVQLPDEPSTTEGKTGHVTDAACFRIENGLFMILPMKPERSGLQDI